MWSVFQNIYGFRSNQLFKNVICGISLAVMTFFAPKIAEIAVPLCLYGKKIVYS